MLKSVLLCSLFLLCLQNENTGRHKRQVSPSSVVSLPGDIKIIRRSNVPNHGVCAKLCTEEKLIKCQYFKYQEEKKMCFLSDRDQPNIAVDVTPQNTTTSTTTGPNVEEQQKHKLTEIAELLFKIKNASQKPTPKVAGAEQVSTKKLTKHSDKGQKKAKYTKGNIANLKKNLENTQSLRDKIHLISKSVLGNFTKIKEMQIRSLLHFNKRMRNIHEELLQTTKEIDKIKKSMDELKQKSSDKNVQESIAFLQKSREKFDTTLKKLEERSAKLHSDLALFHRLTTIIAKKVDALKDKPKNDPNMQRFQAVAVKSMEELSHHGKKIQKRIRNLEQNIKLVAHALVMSQTDESKSKSMIENINKELTNLRKAVQDSYMWHNVKQLGGIYAKEEAPSALKKISHLLRNINTYIGQLNIVSVQRLQRMNRKMNKFLSKTLKAISKMEKRRKKVVRKRIGKMKQVLIDSLKALAQWTQHEEKEVKSLNKKMDDLALKTSRFAGGRKVAEKNNQQLKIKLNKIKKTERKMIKSLANLEKSTKENSAKLQENLKHAMKKTLSTQDKKMKEINEKKLQTALTATRKVNRRMEILRQKEDKKLKEAKAKMDKKVKVV
ncbi:titin homolog [Saccostrea echinata]|uniref:titin homolog n=1 Tax=Saccostrea echinata TaxID=191078 RepID=UPI002A80E487|nr:titin homolog [Saccostrea echinata]